MKANINKAYSEKAMELTEQIVGCCFLLALHEEGYGAQRLNRIKRRAVEICQEYADRYGKKDTEHRGSKYQMAAIIPEALERDVKALGVEETST